jgi:hypothetical protein
MRGEEGEEGDTGDADMEEEGGELTVRVVGATTVRMGPGLHVLAVAPSAVGCSTRVAINGLDARVPDAPARARARGCRGPALRPRGGAAREGVGAGCVGAGARVQPCVS